MKTKLFILLVVLSTISTYSQCVTIPANTSSNDLIYTFSGGSFQSFGCAPIDPTYWMAGSGPSVTVTFTTPQDYPKFRVWGMNTDDVAAVMVNGLNYLMNGSTAFPDPKVVCGISPGPNGVAFTNGNIAGANTPQEGNYSYNDIQLIATGVSSYKVTGLAGAGWGFAGTVISCPLATNEYDWNSNIILYSNANKLYFDISQDLLNTNVAIYDMLGKQIQNFTLLEVNKVRNIENGIYLVKMENSNGTFTKKILVQ